MTTHPPTTEHPMPRRTHDADPYLGRAVGVAVVLALTLPVIVGVVYSAGSASRGGDPSPGAAIATGTGGSAGGAGGAALPGRQVYERTCQVCHGPDGEGIPALGKPLRNSAWVQEHDDEELWRVIAEGRTPSDPANTSGVLMPPRGAQGLSDSEVMQVVEYVRSMQDPSAPPVSVAAWTPDEGDKGARGTVELTEHPGYDIYQASCAACHGQGGEGIEGLGLPMTTSGFVRGMSDDDLIRFIRTGRPMWDENNVTGMDMPPKGGNPAVTDEQLQLIVDYIRAIQERAVGG